jgi:phosphoglycerate dehydrogenase-like enzyme
VISPHIGGQTHEAMRRVAMDAAESILAAYRGETLVNAVNVTAVAP